MSAGSARRSRRYPAVVGVVVAVLASLLAAPTAAYAATVDLSVEIFPTTVSGTKGDIVAVSIDLINLDLDNDSGPASVAVAIIGSTFFNLDTVYGSCDVAAA